MAQHRSDAPADYTLVQLSYWPERNGLYTRAGVRRHGVPRHRARGTLTVRPTSTEWRAVTLHPLRRRIHAHYRTDLYDARR